MKNILFTAIALLSLYSYAQEKQRLKIGTLSGYEYNYFKSPNEVQVGDTLLTEEDLIKSSVFVDVFANYGYRYKWKGHRIRATINPYARLFQENTADSYWNLDGALKYDYRLAKRTKLLAAANFERMNREGLDGAQDVLVNPLGYTNYGGLLGLQTRLTKGNKSVLQGFYNRKNFDGYGTRDLEFNEYGVQLSSKQDFRPGKYEHSFGFTAYYKKRLYQTFNSESNPQTGERNWDYAKVVAFYSLPVTGTFTIESQLSYYARFDRLEDRSGFQQYGPGMRLRFKNDKTRITASGKYIIRNYTEITAPGTEDDLLQYQYLDFALNLEHELPIQGFYVTGTVYSRLRETNTVDLAARSFRGYVNQYAGVGLSWKL